MKKAGALGRRGAGYEAPEAPPTGAPYLSSNPHVGASCRRGLGGKGPEAPHQLLPAVRYLGVQVAAEHTCGAPAQHLGRPGARNLR